jgi:hypothetical protein
MQGLMMTTPLLITSLIQFAARNHNDTTLVTRGVEGAPFGAALMAISMRGCSALRTP